MVEKLYIDIKVKFKSKKGFIKTCSYSCYDEEILNENLFRVFNTIEAHHANVNIRRVFVKHDYTEHPMNNERRIFLRKEDKYLTFNGKPN